ncbi:MAG: iron-siderophore ABC transporter substrate-binding protein [Pikeienuella sp.]
MRTPFLLSACLALFAAPALSCEGRLVEGADYVAAPICAPEAAQRIVVLDPTYSLGMALELDLPVVGAPMFGMSDAALHEDALARGVADLGAFTEPSLEAIAALRPDLIIGSGMLGEGVQAIASQIAPTVMITAENWKTYYRRLAEATGRANAAEEILGRFEARVEALKPRIPDQTVSVIRITPWDFQVYLDSPQAYAPFLIMRELGVKRPPYETAEGGETMKRPDWEELSGLSGDILLYIVGGSNDSAESGRHEEVTGNPLWKMLPAVEAGRVHRLDPGIWMEFNGAGSANRVLDDIERYIAGGA